MRPLNILLGDLTYFNSYTRSGHYVPLASGFISAYAKKLFGRDVQIKIVKDPEKFIAHAAEVKPDIIGMSLYFWNTALNHAVIQRVRSRYGKDPVIVYGGPSVDTDALEQKKMFRRFPEVDALVTNEGELGFANIIRAVLSGRSEMWNQPIDGVVFRRDGELVSGKDIGLTLDLDLLGSPYLSGLMDDFLTGYFQPLLQTSRLCPYTCAFCVSGKTRGKLRAFPIEQVKEEISFIARAFKDRPHFTCYLADENFGILSRDVEIAEHIQKCSAEAGYPKSVFFYNDKRFTETSRQVLEKISSINAHGLTLALQTENPETLKAIHRTNLSSEEIDSAIRWAGERGMAVTTEIIFGLPFETKKSFVDLLERSVARGFDSVLCHNVFVMDGIEMNRDAYREKHRMQTKHRVISTSYGMVDGEFLLESEEVVTSTAHFSFEDYAAVRQFNFMFYAVYAADFYKWFFNGLRYLNVPLTDFFEAFMNPDPRENWPEAYLGFVREFKNAFQEELFDTREELTRHVKKRFDAGGVREPSRINKYYAARLIYLERAWVAGVLREILSSLCGWTDDPEQSRMVESLLAVCDAERIDLWTVDDPGSDPEPAVIYHDLIQWKAGKFKRPLPELKIEPVTVTFQKGEEALRKIRSFHRDFSSAEPGDYAYHAIAIIIPRNGLLHELKYSRPAEAPVPAAAGCGVE